MNDTSIELGGSLGITVLGSLLATSYGDHLSDATAGSRLPASTPAAAQDSVGAGHTVARRRREGPAGRRRPPRPPTPSRRPG
nr:hypothetical protein [Streptomyces canus]